MVILCVAALGVVVPVSVVALNAVVPDVVARISAVVPSVADLYAVAPNAVVPFSFVDVDSAFLLGAADLSVVVQLSFAAAPSAADLSVAVLGAVFLPADFYPAAIALVSFAALDAVSQPLGAVFLPDAAILLLLFYCKLSANFLPKPD